MRSAYDLQNFHFGKNFLCTLLAPIVRAPIAVSEPSLRAFQFRHRAYQQAQRPAALRILRYPLIAQGAKHLVPGQLGAAVFCATGRICNVIGNERYDESEGGLGTRTRKHSQANPHLPIGDWALGQLP